MDAVDGITPEARGKPRAAAILLPAGLALAALACGLVVAAPNLVMLSHHHANTFEWFRADDYFRQAADPFRADVDPAMRWRLLPPLIAHWAGLRGMWAQALPWLGLVTFLTYVASVFLRRSGDWRFAFGGVLLIATTSAARWPANFLGFNDAWVWLGLTVLAVEEAPLAPLAACLLCPWVDERFVIGAPLAWMAGRLSRGQPVVSRDALAPAGAIVLYLAARLALGAWLGIHVEGVHMRRMLGEKILKIGYGPMGWWMGLRAAWIPIAAWFAWTRRSSVAGIVLASTALAMILLSEDESRSAAVAIPLAVLGMLTLRRRFPGQAAKIALAVGALGLILPAATVEDSDVSIYDNLAVQLWRLWKG